MTTRRRSARWRTRDRVRRLSRPAPGIGLVDREVSGMSGCSFWSDSSTVARMPARRLSTLVGSGGRSHHRHAVTAKPPALPKGLEDEARGFDGTSRHAIPLESLVEPSGCLLRDYEG